MKKFLPALLLAISCPLVTLAQVAPPDHRGESFVDKPEYRGVKADAPIPASMHVRNEGGSDQQGLCVISSILANGLWQKVPGLNIPGPDGQAGKGSLLWRTAKSRPGGYSPDKLAALVNEVMPREKYASRVGDGGPEDQRLLEKVSRAGFPIGVTMNTGRTYRYQSIHHLVSLLHYRRNGWAMILDNNKPGYFSVMPSSEFNRRWIDQGMSWSWFWTRLPSRRVALGGTTLVLVAVAFFIVVEAQRKADRETQEFTS